jgi:hypothetical protein
MNNEEKWTLFGDYAVRSLSTLLILVLLTCSSIFGQVSQSDLSSNAAAALTIDQIESVLKRGADPSSVATMVRRRGVDFKFNQSAKEHLLAAKANAALMIAVGDSRRVVAPQDDPQVCSADWSTYECSYLLICVAPNISSKFGMERRLDCDLSESGVHQSQMIKGSEGAYRRWFRASYLVYCPDCYVAQLPPAFSHVIYFAQDDVRQRDVDDALGEKVHQAIHSGWNPDADDKSGVHDAEEDLHRWGKYEAKCSNELTDEAEKNSAPLPATGPPLSAMASKPGVAQACPAGYSSHMCNDGMQILCVSPNFSSLDLSKLETSSSWKGAGCHSEDTPVPASGLRGDPYKAGYSRGFVVGPVIAVRAVSIDPASVHNSDFNARLSQLGIYSFGRVVEDPSKAPDCTWSMTWEQGYREGRKAYVDAIAKATAKARQIEATQGHGKKTPQ